MMFKVAVEKISKEPASKATSVAIGIELVGFVVYALGFSGWGSTTTLVNIFTAFLAGAFIAGLPLFEYLLPFASSPSTRRRLLWAAGVVLTAWIGFGFVFEPVTPKWLVGLLALSPTAKIKVIYWATWWWARSVFSTQSALRKTHLSLGFILLLGLLMGFDPIQRLLIPQIYPVVEFITFSRFLLVICVAVALRGAIKFGENKAWVDVVVFFTIWVIAAFLWNALPNARVLASDPGIDPNYQYIPINDALKYDLTAAKIALGKAGDLSLGSWANLAYLFALGKLLIGFDPNQLIQYQIVLLGAIPAVLYLIGKRLGSRMIGLMTAGLYIASMATMILSLKSPVNLTYTQTEPLMSLGISLIALVLIDFVKNGYQTKTVLVYGAVVGFFALVRVNALPLLALPSLLVFRWNMAQIKKAVIAALLVFAGASLIILPFAIRNIAKDQNQIYFSGKLNELARRLTGKQNLRVIGLWESRPEWVGADKARSAPDYTFDPALIKQRFFPLATYDISLLPRLINDSTIKPNSNLRQHPFLRSMNFDADGFNAVTFIGNSLLVLFGALWFAKRKQLAGLIPLLLYISYFFTTIFSSTLIPRHVFPINWIPILYFSAALVVIGKNFVYEKMAKEPSADRTKRQNRPIQWVILSTGILLIGSFFPVMEAVIPFHEMAYYRADSLTGNVEPLSDRAKLTLSVAGYNGDEVETLLRADQTAVFAEGNLFYPLVGIDIEPADQAPLPLEDLNMFTFLHQADSQYFRITSEDPITALHSGELVWALYCPDPLRAGRSLALFIIAPENSVVIPRQPVDLPSTCPK